jgi:hypothetical protein
VTSEGKEKERRGKKESGTYRNNALKSPSDGDSSGANGVSDERSCPSLVIIRKDHLWK